MMNLNEQALRLRKVTEDILVVARGSSIDGDLTHANVIKTTAVAVESLLRALANTNNLPDGKIRNYRNTFVGILDRLIENMEHHYEHDNWPSDVKSSAELTVVR